MKQGLKSYIHFDSMHQQPQQCGFLAWPEKWSFIDDDGIIESIVISRPGPHNMGYLYQLEIYT